MTLILEQQIEGDLDLLDLCCHGFFYKELWEKTKKRINLYDGKKKDEFSIQLNKIKEDYYNLK